MTTTENGGATANSPSQTPSDAPIISNTAMVQLSSAHERRAGYGVRPGYSSGASSYDGSITDEDELDGMGLGTIDGSPRKDQLNVSRHSDILALGDLRQELVADGDLTKTVVRIEVSQRLRLKFFQILST